MADEAGGLARNRNIDALIRDAVKSAVNFKARIKDINDDFKEYKTRVVKGDLGWTLSEFNMLVKLYETEQEIRDRHLSRLRIGFQALSMGQQLDWVDAVESDRRDEAVETDSPRPPGQVPQGPDWSTGNGGGPPAGLHGTMGYEAGLAGKDRDSNPNLEGSAAYQTWDQGYLDGQEELAKGLGEVDRDTAPVEEAIVTRPRRGRPPKAEGAPKAPYNRKKEDEALFH
jgi:ribosome modulation factor